MGLTNNGNSVIVGKKIKNVGRDEPVKGLVLLDDRQFSLCQNHFGTRRVLCKDFLGDTDHFGAFWRDY